MLYKVFDKNGNPLLLTDREAIAHRFLNDNPERGYSLSREQPGPQQHL